MTELYLIVDDDEVFAQVLERSLQRQEKQVLLAHSIAQAVEIVGKVESPITHAIVDLKLGEESGLELTKRLKDLIPEIKIVILTGFSSISTAVEAIKLGATQYLCKPADIDEILLAFDGEEGDETTEIASSPPSVSRLEWEHIQKVLHRNDGNISATARDLGMHRRTLQRKLQKRPVKK